MIPLRAYVMLWSQDTGWQVFVCRDLDAITRAWKDRQHPEHATGILHIGFDRPLSRQFEEVARQWPGRMLVTTAAKHALPKDFESSVSTIGFVETHGIHLAIKGWGYSVSDDELARAVDAAPEEVLSETPLPVTKGWVASLVAAEPTAEAPLRKAGIYDESSYLIHESELERQFRYWVGLFRYRALIAPDANEPAAILQAAPPWLLNRPIVGASLSVRAFNILHSSGIKTFGDLIGYSVDDLLSLHNFGRKSVDDLRDCLVECLNEGPADVETKLAEATAKTLVSLFESALAQLDERERDIFSRRIGFRKRLETLQSIGGDYGITRERVRQIEVKCLRRLRNSAHWDSLLTTKLGSLLHSRDYPLPVLGLEAADPWFEGVSASPSLIRSLVANFCADSLSIVKIDGIEYISRITQEDWDYALHEAHQILASGAGHNWSEEHCRSTVSGLLKETSRELRNLLWDKARALCHFSDSDDGSRVLQSYGRGAEQLVEAVLFESDRPLHYTEIAERVAARAARPVDIRRIHNAAAAVGILLGRGTFGLEKHAKLPADVADILREEAENLIVSGPDGRQWHTSELCTLLAERHLPDIPVVNKYVLDMILRQSPQVRSLGRMVWSKLPAGYQVSEGRIDVRQAIISLLTDAGSSLSATEIRHRLVALRGVNSTFQISAQDPLIRVGPGIWGLNDRDIPLKRPQQAQLIDGLVNALMERQEGIHISEISSLHLPNIDESISPQLVFYIATLDPRIRSNAGQYIFLSEWDDVRRVSPLEAVKACLHDATNPLSIEQVRAVVEGLIKRPCETRTVSACLQAIDADFDKGTNTWSLAISSDDTTQLEEAASA
jgi:hypothetical protein